MMYPVLFIVHTVVKSAVCYLLLGVVCLFLIKLHVSARALQFRTHCHGN